MSTELPDRCSVAARYDRVSKHYDAYFVQRPRAGRTRILDREQLAVTRGAGAVLELGCGSGRLLSQVDEECVRIGVDISRGMLGQARKKGLRNLLVADAQALPFPAGSFDAVLAGYTVFRYLEPARAMWEVARVLSPSGRAVIHHMAARTWSVRGSTVRHPLHLERADELDEHARRAGLEIYERSLWRPVRVPPYLLSLPAWLPGRWWRHCLLFLRHRRD